MTEKVKGLLAVQNKALSNYSEDLKGIIDDIKSLKKEDTAARNDVAKSAKRLNRLQHDVHVAQKDEDVSLLRMQGAISVT